MNKIIIIIFGIITLSFTWIGFKCTNVLALDNESVSTSNEKVKVTFNIYNNKQIDIVEIDRNTAVKKPIDPQRQGYLFLGWYKDPNYTVVYNFNELVDNDITIYAKWSPIKYNIVFKSNGGSAVPNARVSYNNMVQKPKNPTKKGYVFIGWYKDPYLNEKFSFLTEIKKDLVLYARWEVKPLGLHDVTFVPGLGQDPFILEYEDGSSIDDFVYSIDNGEAVESKWYVNPEKTILYDFASPIKSDITLYGSWFRADGSMIMEVPDTASPIKTVSIVAGIAILIIGFIFAFKKILTKD